MDKTLDGTQLVHRLLMALTLAMVVLGCSIQQPTGKYRAAKDELEYLQNVLDNMIKFRSTVYQAIYERSELKRSVVAWLFSHKSGPKSIDISTIDPEGIAVPDPNSDPHVTVEQEVRWVDTVFSDTNLPFVVCAANRHDIFSALDTAFAHDSPHLESIIVEVRAKNSKASSINGPWTCSLSAASVRAVGPVSTIAIKQLNIPTEALEVQNNQWVGPDQVEVDAAMWLKGHGFGDFEDNRIAPIRTIRELWPELRTHDVSDIDAFLDQQEIAEAKRSEQKIEVFGQPLNGALSTMFLSILTLLALIYFVTLAIHARRIASGNEKAIREYPLFGLLNHSVGKIVLLCTVSIFPAAATAFDLIVIFPRFKDQWLGPNWIASSVSRWICISAVALVGLMAVAVMLKTGREARNRVVDTCVFD
jgi:hypothetical protein